MKVLMLIKIRIFKMKSPKSLSHKMIAKSKILSHKMTTKSNSKLIILWLLRVQVVIQAYQDNLLKLSNVVLKLKNKEIIKNLRRKTYNS
jgi:hypothetical protein